MSNKGQGLTDARIRALKPLSGKRVVERDEGRGSERGLELRITEQGLKTWTIRYYRPSDGKRVRLRLGTYPAMSLEEARKECRAARYDLDKGNDPSIAREQRKGADTFHELAEEYLRTYAKHKKSRDETRRILEREWYDVIGAMKAGEVKRLTISKHLEKIAFERNAPIAANRALAAVRGVYRWALTTGRLESIPVLGLKRPASEKARSRALGEEEIKAFWAELGASKIDDDIKDVIRLCLILGQRVGEVAGMLKSEVRAEKKLWLLPSERTKNGLPHAVPLSAMAMDIIVPRLKGRSRFVFPGRYDEKRPIWASAPNKSLQRAFSAFSLDPFTVHDLRRTVNTGLSRLGIDVQLRARVLNHVSTRKASVTEGIYNANEYEAEKRNALDRWAAELKRIIDGGAGRSNVVGLKARR